MPWQAGGSRGIAQQPRSPAPGQPGSGQPVSGQPVPGQAGSGRWFAAQLVPAPHTALAQRAREPQSGAPSATLTHPGSWVAQDPQSPGAVWLAQRILSLADIQAADITRQASARAAAIQADAEREAAEVRRQAAEHAAAVREAAEFEAAEARVAVLALSDELGQVAAYVTENLTAAPVPPRQLRPPAQPRPQTRPRAPERPQPQTRPQRETPKPAVRPGGKPSGRPRQFSAMRLVAATMVAMVVAAVTAGSTEVALHGFRFFVFRSAGTGATPGNGLQEDQGPGQPDAPGAHHPGAHHPGAHHPRAQHPSSPGGGGHD